jgi:hypothetical protein
MVERQGWGSTVLGWFIVQEPGSEPPDGAAPGQAGIAADPAVPAADPAAFFKSDPPPAPGGKVDFDAVFEAAGVDADERGRVQKAIGLIASLPAETPAAVKKQIVEASLKAFGVPIDSIIEAGAAQIQALEGYIRAGAADTQKLLAESEARIQQFQAEIARIRTVKEQRVVEQQGVVDACNGRKLDVQRVLEFFGQEAVASVVRSSPRLRDPSGDPSSSQ